MVETDVQQLTRASLSFAGRYMYTAMTVASRLFIFWRRILFKYARLLVSVLGGGEVPDPCTIYEIAFYGRSVSLGIWYEDESRSERQQQPFFPIQKPPSFITRFQPLRQLFLVLCGRFLRSYKDILVSLCSRRIPSWIFRAAIGRTGRLLAALKGCPRSFFGVKYKRWLRGFRWETRATRSIGAAANIYVRSLGVCSGISGISILLVFNGGKIVRPFYSMDLFEILTFV